MCVHVCLYFVSVYVRIVCMYVEFIICVCILLLLLLFETSLFLVCTFFII